MRTFIAKEDIFAYIDVEMDRDGNVLSYSSPKGSPDLLLIREGQEIKGDVKRAGDFTVILDNKGNVTDDGISQYKAYNIEAFDEVKSLSTFVKQHKKPVIIGGALVTVLVVAIVLLTSISK